MVDLLLVLLPNPIKALCLSPTLLRCPIDYPRAIFCFLAESFTFQQVFFTICAEKVCYKLSNMCYKLCNIY